MKNHSILRHLAKNRFWLATGLEIFALAFYFVLESNYFFEYPPLHSVLFYLDDPLAILLLGIAATLVVAFAIWDFQWFYSFPIVIGVSFAVFSLYFGGFLLLDIDHGNIGVGTILTGAVLVRIIFEAFCFRSD